MSSAESISLNHERFSARAAEKHPASTAEHCHFRSAVERRHLKVQPDQKACAVGESGWDHHKGRPLSPPSTPILQGQLASRGTLASRPHLSSTAGAQKSSSGLRADPWRNTLMFSITPAPTPHLQEHRQGRAASCSTPSWGGDNPRPPAIGNGRQVTGPASPVPAAGPTTEHIRASPHPT